MPYFRFVVNNNVAQCADDIRAIVERSELSEEAQDAAKRVAGDILRQVHSQL